MDPIYLDFNSTTPLDPVALEQMIPWLEGQHWNPASSHQGGRRAASAVQEARERVANLIGARPPEVVWTSGATEANNMALKGVIEAAPPARKRLVTLATEHKAVLDTADWLHKQGMPVTVLPVERDGSLTSEALESALGDDVALVSIMAANNETGVVADLRQASQLVHRHGALLHTDATQQAGRLPFDVDDLGVDLASLSAHKLYGPKGVGALYVRRRTAVAPLLHGGGHERGLRSGTANVPGIVGFAAAADLAAQSLQCEAGRQRSLVARFVDLLMEQISDVELVGEGASLLPNTVNFRIPGADAEAVMANAPEVAVSAGSACTSMVPTPSHVLLAMGLSYQAASECLRVSVGRTTTEDDASRGARFIASAAARVQQLTA